MAELLALSLLEARPRYGYEATKLTGTVGNPFCGSEGCEWTGTKKK